MASSRKGFGMLQKIGRSLMLPVALLPAAGILLAFGNLFQNEAFLAKVPALNVFWFQQIARVIEQSGGIIFDNLPLLFAVGVAVGFAEGEGTAGLAAIVGFFIMNVTMGLVAGVTPEVIKGNPAYASVLGIPTLQTGVFGGIIIGVIAALLYKRFYNIELPSYLGFFAGKRFVPIVTAGVSVLIGLAMVVVWPPIQNALFVFSRSMIDTNRTIAAFIFGVIERSLIPFGLHHIFYNPFWYQFGEYVNKAGELILGDQKIFFAQLKDGVPFTAGTFMTGKFPFMMFGLPAAALAMYHEAKPENKKIVGGLLGSAALTSFLTGITEPIEFSFLFVAPVLFAIHTVFAGLSFMIMQILNVKIGMTFSGGVIDYILFGVVPNRTAWWLVIPVGLVFAAIYYFGFRFAIRKLNLKTPGREDAAEGTKSNKSQKGSSIAVNILNALGGEENIKNLDACITRLRVTVNNSKNVDKEELKRLGASGVLEVGNNIQAIFGPKSDNLKTQIKEVMAGNIPKEPIESPEEEADAVLSGVPEKIALPLSGKIIDLSEVPDEVFSQKMMGDGFAVNPEEGLVVSPVNGRITTLFPTKHAIGITSDTGLELLIHIGMDTVNLKGEGFQALVSQDDAVEVGQPLMKFDIGLLSSKVPSVITPVVFTNLSENQILDIKFGSTGKAGDVGFIEVKNK
ncbi:glucose-specific PTS transporter subunit IIBC [Clostridium polynesiense]|uniref:glucose-specific PTS transporter subunit IIBC n=1 Tax=Clostridium polynesiense TaxID=1325933 RepID=UPI00058F149E|nr:glucose-specific PTS transporter subunit IIBC [Clostridium polynesiense]